MNLEQTNPNIEWLLSLMDYSIVYSGYTNANPYYEWVSPSNKTIITLWLEANRFTLCYFHILKTETVVNTMEGAINNLRDYYTAKIIKQLFLALEEDI